MSPRSIGLSDELNDYVVGHSSRPNEVQRRLIERTEELGGISIMQIAPEQGEFMAALTAVLAPTLVVEVGTFTGYSSLSVAQALPTGGRLLCCDVSETWTAVAREAWAEAGVDDRIDLRIGPAIDTLRALPEDPAVDLAFIDADKGGYVDYYEELLRRLAPKGMLLVDNTLWSGAVIDPSVTDADTEAIRRFNDHVARDTRTRQVIVPIGDGVTMIRRA